MINAETVRRSGAEIIENLLSEQILDAAIEVHRSLVDTELSPWCKKISHFFTPSRIRSSNLQGF